MKVILSIGIILALFFVSGCTAITVRPVDTALEIKHVCIEDGQQLCFDGQMMGVIRDGFERHGITTQVYAGNLPSECEYHLSFMCERTWDMATYMHHAELRLYRAKAQVGYAEYHLNGKGGLSLMKWGSTKEKMAPVIDELLSGHSAKQAP
jgi:hypothetical protein